VLFAQAADQQSVIERECGGCHTKIVGGHGFAPPLQIREQLGTYMGCFPQNTHFSTACYQAALKKNGSALVARFEHIELGKSSCKNPPKKT
jgi:hypothetical protein